MMSTAQQSTRPSIFLPVIKATVATALNVSPTFVRLVAQPDPDDWSYHTGSVAAAIWLDTNNDQSDAGAGVVGTPITQVVQVTVRSRSLADQAGGNDTSLPVHLDKELAVVNRIHLRHLVTPEQPTVPLFIMPARLVAGGDAVTRNDKLVSVIESVMRFRIDYVLAMTL